MTINSVI